MAGSFAISSTCLCIAGRLVGSWIRNSGMRLADCAVSSRLVDAYSVAPRSVHRSSDDRLRSRCLQAQARMLGDRRRAFELLACGRSVLEEICWSCDRPVQTCENGRSSMLLPGLGSATVPGGNEKRQCRKENNAKEPALPAWSATTSQLHHSPDAPAASVPPLPHRP
jgi:hypothetical protein